MNDPRPDAESPSTGPSRAATLLLIGAVLGAAIVLFAWMNTAPVRVTVFLWEPEVPKALLMFVPLVVGFLLGWGTAASRRRGRERRRPGRGGGGPGGGGEDGAEDAGEPTPEP